MTETIYKVYNKKIHHSPYVQFAECVVEWDTFLAGIVREPSPGKNIGGEPLKSFVDRVESHLTA